MRFRGKITELLSVRQFAQLLHTLAKCSKQFVFRISADKLIFVLGEKDVTSNGATAWCELPRDPYFSEYNMEGVTPENNEIYLEIASDMMAASLSTLKSSHNVTALKMKLTKKLVPCLTFEIESQTTNSNVVCVHDIPVVIITRRNWGEYQEPEHPTFDVSLAMPDVKVVRLTLERLKNLGPKLTITGSKSGKLSFSVDTYAVKSTVQYSDLRVYEIDNDEENQPATYHGSQTRNDINLFSVDVDMKHILQLIPSENQKPSNFICSLVEGRLVHLYYIYGDITLQYCIPGVSNG